ncbi:metallophosphoesterase family protein [Paenibacillus sp. OSY-SE]|uniref:metallophosphoesterase family protein n=1 Tax=Paenibacillus sp. OSY-SE TaxID=1196323 RepID=UPI001ED8D858|nr:metallophosphoesterase family protein [Paenibacillus sp. OSY-SE]
MEWKFDELPVFMRTNNRDGGMNMTAESICKSLRFRKDGTFTIVQFSDVECRQWEEHDPAHDVMRQVLELEQPDLVVFAGDVIASASTTDEYQAFANAVRPVEDAGIPWFAVYGNHDTEATVTREQLHAYQMTFAHSIAVPDPEGISGSGNAVFPVLAADGKLGAVIYALDSHSYSPLSPRVGGYDWLKADQIAWYRQQSAQYAKEYGGDTPVPAVAFFHIPLMEYHQLWALETCCGQRGEPICSPPLNSGMFQAMVEQGDVMGTFVGHDHANDFIGDLHGIKLAYGRTTRAAYTGVPFEPGARIVRLYARERRFDSWIRLKSGAVIMEQPKHQPEHI